MDVSYNIWLSAGVVVNCFETVFVKPGLVFRHAFLEGFSSSKVVYDFALGKFSQPVLKKSHIIFHIGLITNTSLNIFITITFLNRSSSSYHNPRVAQRQSIRL